MVNSLSLAAAAVSALLVPSALAAGGIYTKNSPVLQVDGKSYNSLVARSNHTTVSYPILVPILQLTIAQILE